MTTAKPQELNGLPPEKLKEVLKSLEQPDVLKAVSGPWRSRIRWQSGFNGKAYMRNHVVEMDEPSDLTAPGWLVLRVVTNGSSAFGPLTDQSNTLSAKYTCPLRRLRRVQQGLRRAAPQPLRTAWCTCD